MAEFTNLTFHVQGQARGSASGWTITMVAAAEEEAAFADEGLSGESFESGWIPGPYLSALSQTALLEFGGEPAETFERRWGPGARVADQFGGTPLAPAETGNEYLITSLVGAELYDFSKKNASAVDVLRLSDPMYAAPWGASLELVTTNEDFNWFEAGFIHGITLRTPEFRLTDTSTVVMVGAPVWDATITVEDMAGPIPRVTSLAGAERGYVFSADPISGSGRLTFGDGVNGVRPMGTIRVSYLAGGLQPGQLDVGVIDSFNVDDYLDHLTEDILTGLRDYGASPAEFESTSPVEVRNTSGFIGTPSVLAEGIAHAILLEPGDGALQVQVSTKTGWLSIGSPFTAPGAIEIPEDATSVRIKTITSSNVTPSATLSWGAAKTI